MVEYVERRARNLIHYIDRSPEVFRFCPHRLAANIYLGCEFACAYCFARSQRRDYHSRIIVRVNAPELAKRELSRMRSVQPVDLGSATDPYQPAERRYELVRATLEVFLELNAPCFIVTKSDLVLRDVDLLRELAKRKLVCVHVSLMSLSQAVTATFEGLCPPPQRRLAVIEELSEEGIPVVVRLQPVMPGVNDSPSEIAELVEAVAAAGARHLVVGTLKISRTVWSNIARILEKLGLVELYRQLYFEHGSVDGAGYRIADQNWRLSVCAIAAREAQRWGLTFGTCKEGFFWLHTHRCSGLALRGRYVPTVETFWRIAHSRGLIRLTDALELLKKHGLSGKFVRVFLELWRSGEYWRGIPRVSQEGDVVKPR